MNDRVTITDRWRNLMHRGRALRAAVSLYRALGRRRQNGIWVFWTSLDAGEQERYVAFLAAAMQRCWHLARDPDVTLPWTPSAEELLALLGSERIEK